jgi:6-phosphogluconate dehydrogenase (decarboxylating)
MGANMVSRLVAHGHECVVFDMSPKVVADLAKEAEFRVFRAVAESGLAETS